MSETAAQPTPAQVAETAKIEDALQLNQLALIGIFSKPSGNTALLRQANGSILTVRQGDRAGRLTITVLDDDKVHLSDGSILLMPA